MAGKTQETPTMASASGANTPGMGMFQQAYNEFNLASEALGKDKNNPALIKAQKDAQKKFVQVAIQSGILDETTEFGKAFAQVAPKLRIQLLEYQQAASKTAADKTLEIALARANDERSSMKMEIDSLFNLEKSGVSASVGFAGFGRAICSFLRALGVDGMDEYIQRFDREIRSASDSVRDVKWKKLKETEQVVNPTDANRIMQNTTDAVIENIPDGLAEAIVKANTLVKGAGQITGNTGPSAQTVEMPKPSKEDAIVSGTARAVEIAKKAATDMGLKDPEKVQKAIIDSAKLDGNGKDLSRRELMDLEVRIITGEGKEAAQNLIKRIKEGASAPDPKLTVNMREPALDLNR